MIVSRLSDELLTQGHTPYLFFTNQRPNPAAEPELSELFKYERALLNDYIYPYLDAQPHLQVGRLLSPAGIARLHQGRVVVRVIPDVNDASFVTYLAEEQVRIGFSVRCYQKFRRPLIDHFRPGPQQAPLFANLHPGLLPRYRGVLTFARSMLHGETAAGFTLHRVNEAWDAGDIISMAARPLDYGRSVLENMCDQRDLARDLLRTAIETAAADGQWPSNPQVEADARYFSHLTRADLDELGLRGIDLVHPRRLARLLADEFTHPDTRERYELTGMLAALTSRRAQPALI
ncbi:formyltransferase family protein [Actinoplanes sp. KI2]|uniref:formyltransferase family protein n=1 Tax=Actinoplanes sp. KI2 TaxID=2983315 RepID=UPI0021D5D437|nr:formyltransferase family protein [Actinoplanes sp. KI2]MCU7729691.1 formyltransferase family protein [Actinoplanes sp. KI2]